MKPVTIVIPVYADWPSLKDCLEAITKTVDLAKHQVMLVNDCGPEVDELEASIKNFIKDKDGFEYHRNSKNLGFVRTCNRAVLELDKTTNDILLLNSDTKPTKGWLEELIQLLALSPKNLAVSPRSSNATIATIPLSRAVTKGVGAEASYEVYKKIKSKLPRYYVAPVAFGYCMLIRRSLINKYGLFDEKTFGQGYGEEVDFCRRLKKHGFQCIMANHAYVFHLEARSFTPERKKQIIERNYKIIWNRYPDYRQEVRAWMDEKVPFETAIEESLGIYVSPKVGGLRGKLKRYPAVYKPIRSIYRRLSD